MRHGEHVPGLRDEAVAALAIRRDGTYVDATFGRGGHARRVLDALGADGHLVALDRDPAAELAARTWTDPRFIFCRNWFSELPQAPRPNPQPPRRYHRRTGESASGTPE